MKALVITALLALSFTTGFTCSKNAPEASKTETTTTTETTMTAETTPAAPAEGMPVAPAEANPAGTSAAPATETK